MQNKVKNDAGSGTILRKDWLVAALFPLLVFGILAASGNLTTGPRMPDENQIYKLQIEFGESSFLEVLKNEIRGRMEMRRLVPVFNVQKIVFAKVFGGNLVAWSVAVGLLSAGSCILLFLAFRLCDYSTAEALVFGFFVMWGQQSVVWWRLLHGEGLAMVLLGAGLVAMGLRIRGGGLGWEIAFSLLLALAALTKESFLLVFPAMIFLKVALTVRIQQLSWRLAVKQGWLSIGCLGLVFVLVVYFIKFHFGTTEFQYTGWSGFNPAQFRRVVGQYLRVADFRVVGVLLALILVGQGLMVRRDSKRSVGGNRPLWRRMAPTGMALGIAATFWGLITVPQLLLYMKSGILSVDGTEADYSRYIVPAIIGFAFLLAELLRILRTQANASRGLHVAAYSMVALLAISRGTGVAREANAYAEFGRVNDQWFDAAASRTENGGAVVIVYLNGVGGGGYSTQAVLRAYYILNQRHGIEDIYFLPIPDLPSIQQGAAAAVQADTRHHGRKMRHIGELPVGARVATVLIMNWGAPPGLGYPTSFLLEDRFRAAEWRWFDPAEYSREYHPHSHISYYRDP